MDIHEYQAKKILSDFGVKIPTGGIVYSPENAAAEGKGAAQLDGRMIDAASARMAENIVNINKLIESK